MSDLTQPEPPARIIRQGDMTAPHLPSPGKREGRAVDVAALTAQVLSLDPTDRGIPPGQRLIEHLREGGRLRLLLTSRLTQAWWAPHMPSIEGHAAVRDARIERFLADAGDAAVHVEIREHLWLPSVGLTAWSGPNDDEGMVWIVPYTLDPAARARDKTHFGVSTDSPAGRRYREQFEGLWSKAHPYDARADGRVVLDLEEETHDLLTRAARRLGRHADVAVVIALSEELRIFREACDEVWGRLAPDAAEPASAPWLGLGDGLFEVKLPPLDEEKKPTRRMIVGLIGAMGKVGAAEMTRRILDRYLVDAIGSLGIAGLMSSDLDLGDVVVASAVHDYLHRAKAHDRAAPYPWNAGPHDFRLDLGGAVHATDPHLVRAARDLEFAHSEHFADWERAARARTAAARGAHPSALGTRPLLHADDVHLASGDVVAASTAFQAALRVTDRNLMAVEMEAAGVVVAARERPIAVPSFVIRGVSDRADPAKSALDEGQPGLCGARIDRGAIRRAAMKNASRFLLLLIETGALPGDRRSRWPGRDPVRLDGQT